MATGGRPPTLAEAGGGGWTRIGLMGAYQSHAS
jgi:hypothetical protein